jgi:hypothetical protein
MPIDSRLEELISLADAARLLPARRRGKRPHISCLYRLTTVGCRGVILESAMVGGTRCTSRKALARFISRLTALQGGRSSQSVAGTSDPGSGIEQQLDAEGIA